MDDILARQALELIVSSMTGVFGGTLKGSCSIDNLKAVSKVEKGHLGIKPRWPLKTMETGIVKATV